MTLIPSVDDLLLPIMKLLEDGNIHTIRDVINDMGELATLTDEEKHQLTPVGKRSVFSTRIMWAVSTLRNSRLLENTQRGEFKITKRGSLALRQKPDKIDRKFLLQYPEFRNFIKKNLISDSKQLDQNDKISPIEIIEKKCMQLEEDLCNDLLSKIKNMHSYAFENLVVKLLVKMGYGFTENKGKHIQKTHDGGIDGVINQDELRLEQIYIQAKRWNTSSVGVDKVHSFIGALSSNHAKKGVLMTTSYFTQDAKKAVENIEVRVVLIDGEELTKLLYKNNMGVTTSNEYFVKKIDQDFFDELLS